MEIFYLRKPEGPIHTEMTFVKSQLMDQVSEAHFNANAETQNPKQYFSSVEGDLMIFTYLSPCELCASSYISISRAFPNLQIHVYYSKYLDKYYDDKFKSQLWKKSLSQIKNDQIIGKKCSAELEEIRKSITQNCYWIKPPLNKNLDELLKYFQGNSHNNFCDYVYRYSRGFPAKNITFKKIALSKFLLKVYDSIDQL